LALLRKVDFSKQEIQTIERREKHKTKQADHDASLLAEIC
jgi:hypothetical protein